MSSEKEAAGERYEEVMDDLNTHLVHLTAGIGPRPKPGDPVDAEVAERWRIIDIFRHLDDEIALSAKPPDTVIDDFRRRYPDVRFPI